MNKNNTNETVKNTAHRDYKAFNLAFEYSNYSGYEKYAIATDLSEEELLSKYGDEIKAYEPYVLITWEMGEAMSEFKKYENTESKRSHRGLKVYADDLINEFYYEETPESKVELDFVYESIMTALNMIDETTKARIIRKYVDGLSLEEIGIESGCTKQAVSQSIKRGLNEVREILKSQGVCE